MGAGSGRTATRVSALVGALAALTLGSLTLLSVPHASADTSQVPGMDVSGHQGNVDWQAAWAAGARFAYIKATEGTGYRNPYFAQQYNGSYQVGMIRGAYHFARPDVSDGPAQADFFVAHGGAWSPDGKTLPPMLDIEYNPYGPTCYGLSPQAMTDWIKAFSERVHARTSRWPMLYTTTDWWKTCTGNSAAFGDTHPLFIARYASSPGPLPSGWRYYTMWQYSDSGDKPGDQDTFNGSMDQLVKLAGGDARGAVVTTPAAPASATAPPTTSATTSTSTQPTTTTTPSTSGRTDPTTATTTAPPATTTTGTTTTGPSSTPHSAALVPPTTTSAKPAPRPQQISGLVWTGQRDANPPSSLREGDTADELVARVDPAPPQAAAAPHNGADPAAQAESRPLASTGTDVARAVVFGAALLLLGVILAVLARAVRPRRTPRT